MKIFDVIVTRDCSESVTIRVKAENPEEAADKAIEKAEMEAQEWEINDGTSDPYLAGADLDDVEEVEEEKCQS